MNRMSSLLLLVLFLAFLTGCATTAFMPPRQDPFSGLGLPQAQAGYANLSIALVASKNTKATVDLGHRNLAGKMTDDWLKQDFEFFQRHFGKVLHAGSIPEAWAAGVDLVAVYDVYEQSGLSCKYDETVVFLLPSGAELDRIHGATDTSMLFGGSDWLSKCVGDVQSQLAAGINGSKALGEFAQNKTAGTPAVAQKPPAPTLPDILRPSQTAKPDDSAFAVVVGIERYARIPQADFAERDAHAVTEHLLAMGVPRRNIIHLAGPEASYSSLKKYLESWLPKNVQPGSRVFFYFSGHGAPDIGTGEAYLLPWDGDPAFLKDTAYPTKRLYEQLASLPAKEVVVATDACFSGAGGRSVLAKGARPLIMKVDGGAVPASLTVFAAAAADQITSTLEDKGHGMFTYFFLKGLGGDARDASGRVTAKGLLDYLKPKVQDAARRQNRDQEPVLAGPGDRELVRF